MSDKELEQNACPICGLPRCCHDDDMLLADRPAPSGEALQAQTLTHTRSCPALTPGEDDCTCGLRWRIYLQTEQEMHNAWRKRAEEAESALADERNRARREALELAAEVIANEIRLRRIL